MRVNSNQRQQQQIDELDTTLVEVISQFQQIAKNQADLLSLVLQMQLQIDQLKEAYSVLVAMVPGVNRPAT